MKQERKSSAANGTSGTGVSPVRGVVSFTRTRRNLPHWQEPGSVYWLTWKTGGTNLSPAERTVVLDAILYWNDKKWIVYCAVVMPDHVHVLAQPTAIEGADPRAYHELAEIIHSVKSFSAHEINKGRNRRGAIWQDERSDHIIRDEHEFWQKWQYARDNPVKQRLAETPEEYPWFYQRTGLQPPHRRDAGATGATESPGSAS